MRSFSQWGLLGLALLLLAGCGGSSSSGGDILGDAPTGGLLTGGMLRISVTDDPFPIDYVLEASVTVDRIEAHDQDSDGWVVLSTDEVEINLVGLTNGLTKGILDMEVDPGTYDQFRFITGPGRVVLSTDAFVTDDVELSEGLIIETPEGEITVDGYVFTVENGRVKFPSGPQTGIKVHVDPPIVVSTQLSGDLVLEFDLGKNFVFNGPVTHAPGVKRVLFTPSVKASNTTTQGSVTVEILDDGFALMDAEVWLEDAAGKAGDAFSDVEGIALIKAAPGTYTLKADKFGFVEGEILGVVVVLGNLTDAGTITLAPSELKVFGMVYSDAGTPGDDTDDFVLDAADVTLDLDSPTYNDATTTDNGAFSFDRLEEFDYEVTFSKTGFAVKASVEWAPADGAMEETMTALFRTVVVTVNDASAIAMSGASVTATDVGANTWTGATDTNGQVTLTLPTGSYAITATDGSSNSYDDKSAPKVVIGDTGTTSDAGVTLTP